MVCTNPGILFTFPCKGNTGFPPLQTFQLGLCLKGPDGDSDHSLSYSTEARNAWSSAFALLCSKCKHVDDLDQIVKKNLSI